MNAQSATGQVSSPADLKDANAPKSRVASVDTLRVIAIAAVVCLHTSPFGGRMPLLCGMIVLMCRFAVPVFFMLSGYFAYSSIYGPTNIRILLARYSRRLLVPFAVMSLFYILWETITPQHWELLQTRGAVQVLHESLSNWVTVGEHAPLSFIFEGTSPALWFLPALWSALILHVLFRSMKGLQLLAVVGIAFYVAGNLGKSYASFPLGFSSSFDTRDSLFSSLLCVTIGMWLRKSPFKLPPVTAWLLLATFAFIHFVEAIAVWRLTGTKPIQDYYFTTPLFGAAAVVLAFSEPIFKVKHGLDQLGRYTMGVYLLHFAFIPFVKYVNPASLPIWGAWQLFAPLIVLSLSFVVVAFLCRFKLFRSILM